MQTRRSNRTKRYVFEDYQLSDASDKDLSAQDEKSDDDTNFEAGAEETPEEDLQDDLDLDADPPDSGSVEQSDGSNDDLSHVELDGSGKIKSRRAPGRRLIPHKPVWGLSTRQGRPNDLEPYPFDHRQTRMVTGPLGRYTRGHALTQYWYGPHEDDILVGDALIERWREFGVLPSKSLNEDTCPIRSPWLPQDFETAQQKVLSKWLESYQNYLRHSGLAGQISRLISAEEAAPYIPTTDGDLVALLGPHSEPHIARFTRYHTVSISESGTPLIERAEDDEASVGWLLDTGGLVLAMGWAPKSSQGTQILALAVSPHSDQAPHVRGKDLPLEDQKYGIIQLWEFAGEKATEEFIRPDQEAPTLRRTLCVDWGRVKRLQWCPIPLLAGSVIGILATLCSDERVHVFQVSIEGDSGVFEHIKSPMVSLGIEGESNAGATCFTWVNANRIAMGHADGSITLWSLHQKALLARQLIHHTAVIHIASGYPSCPYHIVSNPIGGFSTMIDFSSPSYETSSFRGPAILHQPNLLQWSDHLQGWFSMYPAPTALNTNITFSNVRFFPQARNAFVGDKVPSCLAVGYTHPFLLVGQLDGSLMACNPLRRILGLRYDKSYKLKVFQHEYRPAALFNNNADSNEVAGGGESSSETRSLRGASRIIQGWSIEANEFGKNEKKLVGKNTKCVPKKKSRVDVDDEDFEEREFYDPARLVLHEPLTRITVAAWNPNEGFGCWAAAAMGSGLVRVMDLGLEEE